MVCYLCILVVCIRENQSKAQLIFGDFHLKWPFLSSKQQKGQMCVMKKQDVLVQTGSIISETHPAGAVLAGKLDSHQLAAANSSTLCSKWLAEQLALATLISFDARSVLFPFSDSSTPVLPVTGGDRWWVTWHALCLELAFLLVTCASPGGKHRKKKT